MEKLKNDVGEGKSVDLFSSPLVREQFVAEQIELGLTDDDNEAVQIEEDLDKQIELDSFKRFLQSQGLKTSNNEASHKT